MSLFTAHARHAKFDYYTTSVRLKSDEWNSELAPALSKIWPITTVQECSPARPFEKGTELLEIINNERLLLISRGGDHVKGITSLRSTGKNAQGLAQALTEWGGNHQPTRVDAAIDWCEEHLFDTLSHCFIEFAKEKKIYISTPGNWPEGKERTLYIGSRNSPLMIRLYEKGYEQRKKGDENADLNWVRMEVEVKYKKPQQRALLSKMSPAECFQLGWVADLCNRLMFDIKKLPMPSHYNSPDHDRTLRHVQKQYAALFLRVSQDTSSPQEFMDVFLARSA